MVYTVHTHTHVQKGLLHLAKETCNASGLGRGKYEIILNLHMFFSKISCLKKSFVKA